VIFRSDIVEEAEAIVHYIQDNLIAVKSHQETYANKRHRPLEFEVGDHVYLRVSSMKDMKRFELKGKLACHYSDHSPSSRNVGLWLTSLTCHHP
jgi:exosome complex RNA-binding protein Rrp4